eukprot:4956218-Pyramimonas_sp.AAC.1
MRFHSGARVALGAESPEGCLGTSEERKAFTASAVSTTKMSSSGLNVVAPVSTRCQRSSRSTRWTRSCSSGW